MTKNPVTEGTHEDHVSAGKQSHKNASDTTMSKSDMKDGKSGGQGGTHEQHVNAGKQSNKNA